MEKTVRSQSVKLNLDQLWSAIETLVEEVAELKANQGEIIPIPVNNHVPDILARLDTVEKVLWGTE